MHKQIIQMIISITSLKGGVGKSTLSQNLAVCFSHMDYKVAIIDADLNASSERWSGLRDNDKYPPIMTVSIDTPKALRNNATLLERDYDIVIIDGTPALSKLVSTIMLMGDVIIVPIKPSILDIWATEKFQERYEEAVTTKGEEIPGYFVLNEYEGRMNFNQEAKEAVDDLGFKMLESSVKTRQAYKEAIQFGLGVYEYKDKKAKAEIVKLTNEIISIL